jgi:hypothetical protein
MDDAMFEATVVVMRSRCARGRYVFLLMGRCVSTTPEFPNQPVRAIRGL